MADYNGGHRVTELSDELVSLVVDRHVLAILLARHAGGPRAGHVSAALCTGGTVSQVILHPLKISRTDLAENPHPLIVAWLGPLIGVAAPLGMLAFFKIGKVCGWYLIQFFAGFCLTANGVYIGIGSFAGIGDAGDVLNHGSPIWCLWLFGLLSVPLGLFLWNGLGSHFGLGQADGEVSWLAAYTSCKLFVVMVVVEVAFSLT